jgi:predicted RNase H-like HicB family nuclease
MIFEYCQKAIEKVEYKKLDDGTWFSEIPGFKGVWANAGTVEDCRKELITVLEEWIILKFRHVETVPEVDGLSVQITRVAVARTKMPIARRELIRKFKNLGFNGPYSGGRHQFR